MKKKILPISKENFHKMAECYRELTAGILDDKGIVREFNQTKSDVRHKVIAEIKLAEVKRDKEINQQFALMIVDMHIIAAKYDIDPATVCCIGSVPKGTTIIMLT